MWMTRGKQRLYLNKGCLIPYLIRAIDHIYVRLFCRNSLTRRGLEDQSFWVNLLLALLIFNADTKKEGNALSQGAILLLISLMLLNIEKLLHWINISY